MHRAYMLLLCLPLVAAVASAQAVTPGYMTGDTSVRLAGDQPPSNQLLFGLGISTDFDDNAFNQVDGNAQHLMYNFSPRVAWNVAGHHWGSSLDYSPSVRRSTKFDFYDRTSHALSAEFNFQASKRLSFTAHNTFNRSSDPMFYPAGSEFVPGTGIVDRSNPSYFGVPSVLTNDRVSATANYRLSARSSLGIGGHFGMASYDSIDGSPNSSLRDSNSAGGTAYFNHQFSPRSSAGVSYNMVKITSAGAWNMISHRVLLSQDFNLSPATKISIFAGPDYVSSSFRLTENNLPVMRSSNAWSWSAGATYAWSGARSGVTVNFVRQTSDGGGLQGPVQLTSLGFSLRRRLARKWTADLFGQYSLNDRLQSGQNMAERAHYGSGGASLTWAVRQDLSVICSYARQEQSQLILGEDAWIDRNRATISINYSFTKPVGR